jgi:predicted TIM-barrel fold metal-dependent hydrolase
VLIDWHTHIHSPTNQAKPYWQGRCPMTLENVLAAHALAGLDRSVISNAGHFLRFCKTMQETVAGLEDSNRYLAQCRDLHPDKLVAMATCVPGGGDECLRELERAVKEDDCRAVIIGSSHHGHYPDADEARPFRSSCIRAIPPRRRRPTIVSPPASAGRPTIAWRWRA